MSMPAALQIVPSQSPIFGHSSNVTRYHSRRAPPPLQPAPTARKLRASAAAGQPPSQTSSVVAHQLLDVPWFAREGLSVDDFATTAPPRSLYTEDGRPIYTEDEVEMYPLVVGDTALDLKMHNRHHHHHHHHEEPSMANDNDSLYETQVDLTENRTGRSCEYKTGRATSRGEEVEAGGSGLPHDPRQWSREDVCRWVASTCSLHGLPAPNTERFLMNGKAVCLMSLNMFISRVPLGGKLLYRDFQIRLGRALYR